MTLISTLIFGLLVSAHAGAPSVVSQLANGSFSKNLWTPPPRGMAGKHYGCCPRTGRECGCTKEKVQCCDGSVSLTCECEDSWEWE